MSDLRDAPPFSLYDRLATSGLIQVSPETKFIDGAQAFDVVLSNKISKGVNADDFGPVTPPYPDLWIEGIDTELSKPGATCRIAARIKSSVEGVTRTGEEKSVTSIEVFTQGPNGLAQRIPVSLSFTTHPDGRLDAFTRALIAEDDYRIFEDGGDEVPVEIAKNVSICALFALSLMHCRNVKQSAATHEPLQRKRSSRKRPTISYHVIDVPGYQNIAKSTGPATGTVRLHTARGHFKTYTAEAPLMGKAVGTYYWGWHVRGTKANGEIVSSYRVAGEVA